MNFIFLPKKGSESQTIPHEFHNSVFLIKSSKWPISFIDHCYRRKCVCQSTGSSKEGQYNVKGLLLFSYRKNHKFSRSKHIQPQSLWRKNKQSVTIQPITFFQVTRFSWGQKRRLEGYVRIYSVQAYSARCERHVHARGECARVARDAMQMSARQDFDSRARAPCALSRETSVLKQVLQYLAQ